MQGTSIANIDYDNDENAKIIEDALKETEVLQCPLALLKIIALTRP